MINPIAGTYTPDRLLVAVGGVPIDGWADGDVVTITPQAASWKSKTGVGGEKMRSRLLNNGYDVKLSLMPTSKVNAILQARLTLDQLSGLGAFPLSVTVLSAASIPAYNLIAVQAWIKGNPSMKMGEEVGNIEWEIECAWADQKIIGIIATPVG